MELSVANVKDVIKEAWDARSEWFEIGLSLGLKSADLKAIEKQHKGVPNVCFTTMLEDWLKRTEPAATWSNLVMGLKSVGMNRLADEIERRHNLTFSENRGGK